MTPPLRFIAPDRLASISGGNVYNRGLLSALEEAGADVAIVARDARRPEGLCFVDSLYLDVVPRFAPCHLLAHYLPCLVAGTGPSPVERVALASVAGFVAPSAFMADALERLAPAPRPAVVVEPGVDVAHVSVPPTSRAVLVANLVPGKGVLAFLRALGGRPLPLVVVGRTDVDPEYAWQCRAAAPGVDFVGACPHAAAIALVAASDFLVSSSRVESFGFALAEARALGVPIVARAGGNVAAHVAVEAGGRLFETDEELADECVRLGRDRAEVARRRRMAYDARPPARTWADAARSFLQAFRA